MTPATLMRLGPPALILVLLAPVSWTPVSWGHGWAAAQERPKTDKKSGAKKEAGKSEGAKKRSTSRQ